MTGLGRTLWDKQTALLEVGEAKAARAIGRDLMALTDTSRARRMRDEAEQAQRRFGYLHGYRQEEG